MNNFEGQQTIVSHSGTRHLVSGGGIGAVSHAGRITTQCGMGLKPDTNAEPRKVEPGDFLPGPFIATQDCCFCVAQQLYAPTIRTLMAEAAKETPPKFLTVKTAATACHTTEETICNAVAGAPDLFWAESGIRIRGMMNTSNPNWPAR